MPKSSTSNKEEMDFEIHFYENVLKNTPTFIEALIALGDVYTKRGLYQNGLEIDLRLSALRPGDAVVFYNLACSYCLLNDVSAALRALRQAVELGYDDFAHLESDTDLLNLLKDDDFQEYIQKLKKKKKQTDCVDKAA